MSSVERSVDTCLHVGGHIQQFTYSNILQPRKKEGKVKTSVQKFTRTKKIKKKETKQERNRKRWKTKGKEQREKQEDTKKESMENRNKYETSGPEGDDYNDVL
jgi:hypothetical protein